MRAAAQQASSSEVVEHEPGISQAEQSRVEVKAPLGFELTYVEMKDGRVLAASGTKASYSQDGGRTWSQPTVLNYDHAKCGGALSIIRLASGKLGMVTGRWEAEEPKEILPGYWLLYFMTSSDEGNTWSEPVLIRAGGWPGGRYYDTLIQMKSGRLILPVRANATGHVGMYENRSGAFAMIGGKRDYVEGHAHWPEIDITYVYYSDNEGKTWQRSEGHVYIWLNDGFEGMWGCDEPNVVELQDGRLMMVCRTSLGRLYQAFSTDRGHRWSMPEPTGLASSYSPCRIRRIPKTGDLVLAWNQMSGDETRAGYRRGRLSVAISRDDGKSWEHHKTLDRLVVPDVGRVEPDKEPGMTRALDYVGELPNEYGSVDYPNIAFRGDEVLLHWSWARVVPPRQGTTKLRIEPISWLYEDRPVALRAKRAPPLILRFGPKSVQIPSQYVDDRYFFVQLKDLACIVGKDVRPIFRQHTGDMHAPVTQVVSALGMKVDLDTKFLRAPRNPRVYARVSEGE